MSQEEIAGRLDRIDKSIATLNHEYGEVVTKVTRIATDMEWVKKFFWIVAGASVMAAFMALLTLVKMVTAGG